MNLLKAIWSKLRPSIWEETECSCNKEEMMRLKEQLRDGTISVRRALGMVGYYRGETLLYSGDSFGFRSRIPGECDVCYKAWKKKYNEESLD